MIKNFDGISKESVRNVFRGVRNDFFKNYRRNVEALPLESLTSDISPRGILNSREREQGIGACLKDYPVFKRSSLSFFVKNATKNQVKIISRLTRLPSFQEMTKRVSAGLSSICVEFLFYTDSKELQDTGFDGLTIYLAGFPGGPLGLQGNYNFLRSRNRQGNPASNFYALIQISIEYFSPNYHQDVDVDLVKADSRLESVYYSGHNITMSRAGRLNKPFYTPKDLHNNISFDYLNYSPRVVSIPSNFPFILKNINPSHNGYSGYRTRNESFILVKVHEVSTEYNFKNIKFTENIDVKFDKDKNRRLVSTIVRQ